MGLREICYNYVDDIELTQDSLIVGFYGYADEPQSSITTLNFLINRILSLMAFMEVCFNIVFFSFV